MIQPFWRQSKRDSRCRNATDDLLRWLVENLADERLNVETLTERAAMSPVEANQLVDGNSAGAIEFDQFGDEQARHGIAEVAIELRPLVRCPLRRLCAIPRDNLLGQIDEGAQARGHVAASWIIQAISRIRGRPLA
jgi:hypothetical protein